MHEFSLMKNLFDKIEAIAQQENASIVTKVYIKIGALANISADHFREHFDELRHISRARDAELVITMDEDIHAPDAQDITLLSLEIGET